MVNQKKFIAGVTLIEAVVGVFVFIVIAIGVYEAYRSMYVLIGVTRQKTLAVALANEQLEIVRNLPYSDVGLQGGVPAGKILRNKAIERSGVTYDIETTIRNIDDPFDGTIGGTPNDTSPADYKLVQLDISCATCRQFQTFSLATYVAPRSLELTTGNGAILVQVFDANGSPVAGATVHVVNSQVSPAIDIEESTDNAGEFFLIDVPPGSEAYQITVAKNGYSLESTFAASEEIPHPVKPNVTVNAQQVSKISFAIDRLSELTITAVNPICEPEPSLTFNVRGTKLIGTEPDTPKYDEDILLDGSGASLLDNLEWGNYNITPTGNSSGNHLYVPDLPINLPPDQTRKEVILLTQTGGEQTYSLLVNVRDGTTGLIVPNAVVTLTRDALPLSATPNCAPDDYALFLNLEPETYHLKIEAVGYPTFESDVAIAGSWQPLNVILNQ